MIFWLMAFLLMAGAKDPSCPTGFSRLWNWIAYSSEEKDILADLRKALKTNFQLGLRAINPEKLHIYPDARTLLEDLPKLSDKSRLDFIAQVKATSTESKNDLLYKQLTLLGLYDEGTWLKLVGDIKNHGTLPAITLQFLKKYSDKMPSNLRNKIMVSLGDNYTMLGKERERYELVAPKRLADAYYKYLLRGEEIIQDEIHAGKSAEQAFAKYVQEVQRFIPQDNAISAQQTIDMIKVAQSTFQKEIRKEGLTNGVKNPEIYLGGSVANGRASATKSDFDISANFPVSQKLREIIEKELKKHFTLGENFHVSVAPVKQEFWAKQHPIAFRLTDNSIEMLAYPADGLETPKLESAQVFKFSTY